MEYFVGAFTAIGIWLIAAKVLQGKQSSFKLKRVTYRQSHLFEIIKPVLPFMPIPIQKLNTQASKHMESHMTKFLVLNGNAYWIKDNTLYSAIMGNEGFEEDSKKAVDTTHMDDVQLKEIIFIVDKLNEGTNNDRRSSGN